MNKQSKLFEQSQPVNRHYQSQTIPHLISPDQAVPKQRQWKIPAISTPFVLIAFGLALEAFAPVHLQPSTFLAIRGGQLEGKKAVVASKDNAEAENLIIDTTAPHKAKSEQQIEVAKSDVAYAQNCRLERQTKANLAWSDCMSSGTETSIVCDVKRDQINSIVCPEIPR